MSSIIFIRGFNSYKDDHIHFGPIDLGLAHTQLEAEFSKDNFSFYALTAMGLGSPEEQIEKANLQIQQLYQQGLLRDDVHLLGYSAGGVTARGLAHKIKNEFQINLKSVITLTAPNFGSEVAESIFRKHSNTDKIQDDKFTSKIYQFLEKKIPEQDTRLRQIKYWRRENILEFNQKYPNLPDIEYASITSAINLSEMPFLLKWLRKWHRVSELPSDGIVELKSQPWGRVLNHFELDHGAVIGLKTVPSSKKHQKNLIKFREIVQSTVTFINSIK